MVVASAALLCTITASAFHAAVQPRAAARVPPLSPRAVALPMDSVPAVAATKVLYDGQCMVRATRLPDRPIRPRDAL